MIQKIQARSKHPCSIPFLRGLSLQNQLPNCSFSHTRSSKQVLTMCDVHVSSATEVQSFLVFICVQSFRGKDVTRLISKLQPSKSHNCINSRFIQSNPRRQIGTSCSNHLLNKNSTESTISMFTRKFGGQRPRFPSACYLE